MMDITAVIAARSGSRRLKDKNIAPFMGTTLLEYKIGQLKQVKEVARVVVSSDSDFYLQLAAKHGVTTHKRPQEFSNDTANLGETVRYICEGIDGEHALWAQCTSPLVTPVLYSKAIEEYESALKGGFDSLVSLEKVQKYTYDFLGPKNHKTGVDRPESQDLEPVYFATFGIMLARRKDMIRWKFYHGPNPIPFLVDKVAATDIDDRYDLEVARALCALNPANKVENCYIYD